MMILGYRTDGKDVSRWLQRPFQTFSRFRLWFGPAVVKVCWSGPLNRRLTRFLPFATYTHTEVSDTANGCRIYFLYSQLFAYARTHKRPWKQDEQMLGHLERISEPSTWETSTRFAWRNTSRNVSGKSAPLP